MKKTLIILTIFLFSIQANYSQTQINGELVADTLNFKVLKVWGTHYERGFAYGYLVGDQMIDLYGNYLLPMFGSYINLARQVIEDGEDIAIDSIYVNEAKRIVAGIDSANYENKVNFDYIDVLLSNSFLDIFGLMKVRNKNIISPGCSALMSWGDATVSTDLDGESVISRHVDWSEHEAVIRNQIVVAHIPAEEDEQNWIMIGFAGQISALSGVNEHGAYALNVGLHRWCKSRKSL